MAKRPLTAKELEQRRAAGKLGGRPAKPVSRRAVDRIARERAAVKQARGLAASLQVEVVRTLRDGMRGMLPGSTAQSMIDAAARLAAKGGLHDVVAMKHTGDGVPVHLHVGIDGSQYPPATAPAHDPDAED